MSAEKEKEALEGEKEFVDHGLTPTPPTGEKNGGTLGEEATVEVKKGKNDEEKAEPKPSPASVIKLFRYASWFDLILMLVGTLAAMAHGTALPLLLLFFGDLTNVFLSQAATATIITDFLPGLNSSDINCTANYTFALELMNFTGTITEVIQLSFPQGMCLLGNEFLDAINQVTYAFIGIGASVLVLAYLQISFYQTSAEHQVYKIRLNYYRAVLRQDIAWFDANPTGEISTRLSDDINKIAAGIGDKMSILIQLVATFISGFAIGFARDYRLTLFLLAFTPLLAISGGIFAKLTAAFTSQEQKQYASAGAVAEEVLSSIRTVYAFGGEKTAASRYDEKLKEASKIGAKKGMGVGVALGSIFFCIFVIYGAGFWFGAYLISRGFIDGGTVLAVFFAVVTAALSLGQGAPNIQNLFEAAGAAGTIYETIDRQPPIDSSSTEGKTLSPEEFTPVVELKNVNFTYPSRPDVQVMYDVSLRVEVGQTVALVGPSGCGKSTVVQLIQRFYDVENGEVLVGGVNIKELNVKWLRSHIGVVSQEPVLFDTTIAGNIRYGKEDATMEEIQEAAKNANAHNFIMELPKGYDTLVGEAGTQLSGGQKQRVAIARALVSNPKILLLDEATSALDTESEATVQEALDRAREGRTTIVIAHRLSTIQNADIIVSIEDGRVVETGSHSDLMARKGLYYDLVTAQSYGVDEVFVTEDFGRLFSHRGSKRKRSAKGSDSGPGGVQRQISFKRQGSSTAEGKEVTKRQPSTKEDEEEADKDIPEVSFLNIIKLNAKEWWLILLGVIGSAINGSINPLFAVLFGEILEVFVDPRTVLTQIHPWAGGFLVIGVVSGIAIFTKTVCFDVAGETLTARLRSLSFKAMLRQEIGWYDEEKNSTGALTTRLSADAGQVQGATGNRVGTLIETVVGALLALGIALYYSWLMTIVILAVVPLVMIAGALQLKALTTHASSNKKQLEKAGKLSVDSIENIRTVASLTIEDSFYDQYKDEVKRPYRIAVTRHPPVYGITYAFSQGILFFLFAVIFRFGAFLANLPTDHLVYEPFADVFRVFFAIIFGAFAIGQASAFAPNYSKAKISANRIFFLLNRVPVIDNYSEDGENLETVSGAVTVKDVQFSYPARPDVQVLQGLSLSLSPGKTLALVGPSGCGKSTVVSLIERFYDPSAGSLTLESFDLRDLNLQWLRSQIGIVSQEPVLFDASIAKNIRYGALFREVSDEEVIEAAKSANIHSFIESLPQGYNTNVGAKGTQLSGGQKQRIAIARALIRDPKILLLDEATSALDTESEKVVQEALDKAREGRTSIVIAHRLSTVYGADCIVVIKGGKVAEQGTHSELLANKGIYYKLNRFQMMTSEGAGEHDTSRDNDDIPVVHLDD